MKKSFYVSLALLALGSGVQAQQFTEVSRMEVAPSIMGGRYFSGGKPLFMTTDEGASGNGFTATLYDTDLSEVKRIDFNLPVQTYYTTVKARIRNLERNDYYTHLEEWDGDFYEEFPEREDRIAYFKQNYGLSPENIYTDDNGIMWFVSDFYQTIYYDETTGHFTSVDDRTRPESGWYLTLDNRVFQFDYRYEWMYTGDWKEEQRVNEYTYPTVPMGYYVSTIVDGNVVGRNSYLTQTLFNDDDKFEYLYETWDSAPADTVEYDRDDDGEIDSIVVNNNFVYTGIELRQEDGTALFRHEYAEQQETNSYRVEVYDIGDKVYLSIGEYGSGYVFYSIDKSTSSVSKVKSLPGMLRAYPNPARSGEVLTIDLPEAGAADARRDVRVTSMDGRTMMRQQVGCGERQVQIPLRRMPAGVYNFTLTENGRVVENSRIVVK